MLELLGLMLVGLVLFGVLGLGLKLLAFIGGLILLPFQLLFALAGLIVGLTAVCLLLPFAILAALLFGVLCLAGAGVLALVL